MKLSDGREIRLDDQGYTIARSAPNRADRKMVFDKFWASYKAFENSLGAALATQVKGDMFRAKARHYDSALQAALDGGNLPEAVYRSLIAETNRGPAGAAPLFRAAPADARPARHGLLGHLSAAGEVGPDLQPRGNAPADARCDQAAGRRIWPELFADATLEAVDGSVPAAGQGVGRLHAARAPSTFTPICCSTSATNMTACRQYAHEWGHAMHTLLANAAQPYELSGYPTFTAEVASTAHELLLANMMVERAKTRDDKLFYLGQIMENYRGTFFRQSMFAEFQLAINDLANKGEGLSGEKMSALYFDLLKRYHGPKVQMEPDYASEWAYIQHFYFGFYVWQYATSITAANFFAQKVMHGTAADRDRYLAVLRSGGSDYGYNLLKKGGLDMATAEPYRLIVASFSKVLDQAEALL